MPLVEKVQRSVEVPQVEFVDEVMQIPVTKQAKVRSHGTVLHGVTAVGQVWWFGGFLK